jgi:hypothetical protein
MEKVNKFKAFHLVYMMNLFQLSNEILIRCGYFYPVLDTPANMSLVHHGICVF